MEPTISLLKSSNQDDSTIEKFLINILQKCKFEAERNSLQIPLEYSVDRVSYYTGIPINRLKQIHNKKSTANTIKHSIDLKTYIIILKCLAMYYEREELPTFKQLLQNSKELKKKINDFKQFKQEAMWLGFDYHTVSRDTKLLMEDPKITFERFLYLRKINNIRNSGTLIYYISERVIDRNLKFENPWKQNIEASNPYSDDFVFFHAISRLGYTNGLFCLNPSEEDFYKWVVDILLTSLQPGSVVVLDKSPLHGTVKSKSISMYDTKKDMLKWLQKQNVPCTYEMNKCQLYELVKRHVLIEEICQVDRVLRAHGHEVLRLPSNFETLSPLEPIWKNIKENLVTQIDVKNDILLAFTNMHKDNYRIYEQQIEEIEKEIYTLDLKMDKLLENILLDLKNPDNENSE